MVKQPPRPSIHAAIRQHYEVLPKSERRLAELVLNFPGDLASYAATELASIAEVSNAAVSRFVRRLGFANYDEMRRLARREQEEGAPLYLLGHDKARSAGALIDRHIEAVVSNLRATFSPDSVETIVSLGEAVATAPLVWVTGVRHGRFLADYLRWSLIHARPGIRAFPGAGETIGESIIDIQSDDVAIVFALRRRTPAIKKIIKVASDLGARVAIVTDASMINTDGATWVLRCQTKVPGPIDDHAMAIAFSHTLTEQVIVRLKEQARSRLGDIDDLHDAMEELE